MFMMMQTQRMKRAARMDFFSRRSHVKTEILWRDTTLFKHARLACQPTCMQGLGRTLLLQVSFLLFYSSQLVLFHLQNQFDGLQYVSNSHREEVVLFDEHGYG